MPLIIREFGDRFEATLDGARTTELILDAVEREPTTAMYFGAAVLGGALGSSLSKKREGVLLGAGLGLLIAAVLDSAMDEDR